MSVSTVNNYTLYFYSMLNSQHRDKTVISSATAMELKLWPQILQLDQNVHKMIRQCFGISALNIYLKNDIVNFHFDVVCYSA